MLSVLVANYKGGSGKTTLATNLATAFASGGLRTVLADADRQRNSLAWLALRPPDAAPIAGVDWVRQVGEIPKNTDRLVVDSPAALKTKKVDRLIRMAHVILVPVAPSFFDQETTRAFLARLHRLKPIRKKRHTVVVVRNRVRANARASAELDNFVQDLSVAAIGRLPDRAIFPDLANRGLGVFDLGGKRRQALVEDWRALVDFIEDHS
ncbi:MAG: ParA family protein [Alphaproteobacteria bacterium]|jgi:chromosome partitioning protein|nr:ParA family protein [Alphaproteobacteria bacterium]